MRYQDLGADCYERQRDARRQIAHHVGKLGDLGFEVTLCQIPDPGPDSSASDAADPRPRYPYPAPLALRRVLPHAQLLSIFRVRRLGVRVPPSARDNSERARSKALPGWGEAFC
jgi:hypothetical protein